MLDLDNLLNFIYLENLENNSNDNDDDDDNDNNDNNKTVPTKRESRRAAHVLAETTMWTKCNNNNLLAPDESRIPRNSNEVMHERTKEQLNMLKRRTQQRGWDCCVAEQSQDVEVDASMKTMAPGTWTELILSESE